MTGAKWLVAIFLLVVGANYAENWYTRPPKMDNIPGDMYREWAQGNVERGVEYVCNDAWVKEGSCRTTKVWIGPTFKK